ncbi:MAG: hypothetical protein GX378_08455, partial [Bacteroidales bacterium]|nr:hypothetical protein [Bacteroidales bacterium]
MNEVRLSWVQSENRIDGYVIDKYSHNQWINNFAFVQKNENYWIDTNYFYEPQSIIKYRVSTIAGNNKSQTRELEILPSLPEIAIKEIIKENNTLIIGVDIVKQDPNSELLGYGICYSNHPNPIFGDCNLSEKVNDSVFRLNLITANTGDVYIRAYAHSVFGIAYSEDTLVNIVYDARDGNAYKTVKIGNQIWLAENLKYLPSVVGPSTGSQSTPYYYVYGYDGTNVTDAKATSNYTTYGVLYNWPAAMAGSASSNANPSGVQGVCPAGWHLPSDAEWTELTDYLGGKSVAGGKLKETGTTHWASQNTGATNETGFTALPGGGRYGNDDYFYSIGSFGDWWSASESYPGNAWYRYM